MMKAIISVTRGMDSARQAGRKYKVSARSIGRYIHVLKEMRAKNPIPTLNSKFGGASESAIVTAFRPSAAPLNEVTSKLKVKDGTDAVAQEIHSPSDLYAAEKLLVLLSAGAASGTKTVQTPVSASVVGMTHREAAPPPKQLEKETPDIGDNSVSI